MIHATKKIKIKIILKINIIIIFIFDSFLLHSQVPNNLILNYSGGCENEHLVYRRFISDSVLIDSIIRPDVNQISRLDTFKRVNEEWFYLVNNKWVLYFSKPKFGSGQNIYWYGENYGVNPYPQYTLAIPVRIEKIDNRELLVYRIKEPNYILAEIIEYYFDVEYGLVKWTDSFLPKNCSAMTMKIIKK